MVKRRDEDAQTLDDVTLEEGFTHRVLLPDGSVVDVYLDEPEPLLSNVFCPTGEGGGVDPSCSPGGSGVEPIIVRLAVEKARSMARGKPGHEQLPVSAFFGQRFEVDDYSFPDPVPGARVVKKKVAISQLIATQSDLDLSTVIWLIRHGNKEAPRVYDVDGKLYVKDGHHTIVSQALQGRKNIAVEVVKANYKPGFTPENYTGNVFCPTGEGGGVDPTCTPGGSANPALREAATRLASLYPFPRGLPPSLPPGAGRPDLVAKDPTLREAVRVHGEHVAAFQRATIAHAIERAVTEAPPKLPPAPEGLDPVRDRKKLHRLGRKATEEADAAAGDRVMLSSPGFESLRQQVVSSVPEGKELLAEARRRVESHWQDAVGRENQYRALAGLPLRGPDELIGNTEWGVDDAEQD